MAMGWLCLAFLTGWGVIAQAEPSEPGLSLPWRLVVGTGLFVVLVGFTLLLVMLKVFPRGRRLDLGRKPQQPVHAKKTCPKENWHLTEIEGSDKSEET
jgi:hypothetical protein